MKNFTRFLFLMLLVLPSLLKAQVSAYTFAQSSDTYTEVTGGTVMGTSTTATSFDSQLWPIANGSIPFDFNFNGTNYTGCSVNSNGFVTFGATTSAASTSTAISSTLLYSGAISAWSRDLNGVHVAGLITGVTRWEVVGSAPNREFVIQFKNWRPVYTSSTTNIPFINFQIRLVETTNLIKIVYGPSGFAVGSTAAASTSQIGLRGATNTDFNNRINATTLAFTASTQGTLNTSTQSFNTSVATPGMPSNGLTYTYTPPPACSGTPVGGATATSSLDACPGGTLAAMSVTGATGGPGIVYQWETASDATFSVPANVTGGTGATTSSYTPPVAPNPFTAPIYYRLKVTCSNSSASAFSNVVTISPADLSKTAPTLSAAAGAYCSGDFKVLSVTGLPVGLTYAYQWQKNVAGAGWNPISLATSSTYSAEMINATEYRVSVSACTGSTSVVSAAFVPSPGNCYCTPTISSGCSTDYIKQITIVANAVTTAFPAVAATACAGVYVNTPSSTITFDIPSGTSVPLSVITTYGTDAIKVWVDVNNNFVFEDSEKVGFKAGPGGAGGTYTLSFTINIPAGAANINVGTHTMRIRNVDGGTDLNMTACSSASYGQTQDYIINVLPPPACQAVGNLAVANVAHNSAVLSWVDTNSPAVPSYDVELILASATPTGIATSGMAAVSNNFTATGLVPVTAYKFYVKPNCTSGTPSWAGPFNFTTSPDCSIATPLACDVPTTTGILSAAGSVYNTNACNFGTPGTEKLYTFTTGAGTTYALNVTSINGGSGYIDYAFKLQSAGCDGTGWTCIDDFSTAISANFTLAANTTYYILADAESATGTANHTFKIDCPCSAAPLGGTITGAAIRPTCPGVVPSAMTVTGHTTLGTTLQWQESDDDGVLDPWAAVTAGTGATTATYTPVAFAGTSLYYRLAVTCTVVSETRASSSVQFTAPAAPVTSATNVVVSYSTASTGVISWTNGSGGGRYVVLNTTNVFTDPTTTTDPVVAGAAYSGSGEQIVYDGTGASIAVTGLVTGTTYYARVYEYLRCTGTPNTNYFNTGSSGTNPNASGFLMSSPANDDIAAAVDVTALINSNNSCVSTFSGTNSLSTTSSLVGGVPAVAASACTDNLPNPLDIWYQVTVPAASFGSLTFDFITQPGFSSIVQAYTANGAVFMPVSAVCNNSNSKTFSGLPIGGIVYFRVWDYSSDNFGSFSMCIKYNTALPPTIPSAAATSCVASTNVAISNGNNLWQYLYNTTGSVVAAVRDNGNTLGALNLSYFSPTAAVRQDQLGTYYMNRNVTITPANPNNPATVRIYYTAAEMASFQGTVPSATNAGLTVTHVAGQPCQTSFSGSGALCSAYNNGTDAIGSYVEFDTPSFSSFYIQTGAVALPITLKSFTATEKGIANVINWATETETNVRSFVIEKSSNTIVWTALGATTPNPTKRYSMVDNNPATTTYYRLRNIDNDGREDVSKVVVVNRKKGAFNIASVFPNPSSDKVNIQYESTNDTDISVTVLDMTGRVVLTSSTTALIGFNTTDLDLSSLTSGTYIISMNNGQNIVTSRVTKN